MTTTRHTVHVDRDPKGDGWRIQTHRWAGTENTGSGEPFTRPTIDAALAKAEELQRHRHACRWDCVITLSDEATEAAD